MDKTDEFLRSVWQDLPGAVRSFMAWQKDGGGRPEWIASNTPIFGWIAGY